MSIGSTTRPVYIDNNGMVKPIELAANAHFLRTDTNRNIVNGTFGDMLTFSNGTVKVKNNIPSGYSGPIGVSSDKTIVPQKIDVSTKVPCTGSLVNWNLGKTQSFTIYRSENVNNDVYLQIVDNNGNIYGPDGTILTSGLNTDTFLNVIMSISDAPPGPIAQIGTPEGSWYNVFFITDTGRVESQTTQASCFLPKKYAFRFRFPKYEEMPRNVTFSYRIYMNRLLFV